MRHVRRLTLAVFILSIVLYVIVGFRTKTDTDQKAPVITAETDTLEVNVGASEEELRQGLTAKDADNEDLTDKIMVGSVSKFIKKGTVNVTYVVFDKNNRFGQLTRKVTFKDYHSPRFALEQSLDYKTGQNGKILERLTAEDVMDGDLTDKIRMVSNDVDYQQKGIYTVKVQVTNEYGDTSEIPLLVNVDDYQVNAPEITLKKYLIYLKKGEKFHPENYIDSVTDAEGNEIDADEVQISDEVDTKTPGSYQVAYSVTDDNQKEGIVHMMVIVDEE